MAVFRVERTRDFTVMSNHHLRNTALSLKAKGLLSLMLSLPEEWDYTIKGLAHICKDGVDSISSTVKELEGNGYVVRERIRNEKGQMGDIEYIIREHPLNFEPKRRKPEQGNPVLDNPALGEPEQENSAQLNTDVSKKDISNIEKSNPIRSNVTTSMEVAQRIYGTKERESYRALVLANIEYDCLTQKPEIDSEQLDEIVEIMVDTICSTQKSIRISGSDYAAEVVKSRLLKLESHHIEYVLGCMADNTTCVRNIKKYLLTALYNAPVTISNYYSALVNHDIYGNGQRGQR